MMCQINETQLTENFVAPYLCRHLMQAGLASDVAYCWHVSNGLATLITFAFDPDGYYKDGTSHQHFINPPQAILPAYSIKNIEKLLPAGYLLTLNENGIYQVSLINIYQGDGETDERLPDAYAKLLLQSIKRRIVNILKINRILHHEKTV